MFTCRTDIYWHKERRTEFITAPTMENACCTCRWHEGYTWICFNGESPNCADMTDPENTCECWEARTEENGIGDYEVN